MELNKKNEINKLFEKQTNCFDTSWNSLNNDKQLLEQFSPYIQKFLDIINTYYMSLTELKSSFLESFSPSDRSNVDISMKKIINLLLVFLENILNNNLMLLSNTQSIIFTLNQCISNSNDVLKETQEKNKNIFSSFEIINEQFNLEYLVMMNSFINLENKVVQRYIKNTYHKNFGEDDDDNTVQNCLSITKKLENTFLNFKRDGMKKKLYEYNKNLEKIEKNRILFYKEFKNCIMNIINNFKSCYTKEINYIQNDIDKINNDIEYDHNINTNNNYILNEKEINNTIYNIFKSKNYSINIIKKNEMVFDDITDFQNEKYIENIELKKFLSEEDIYNIIKEIYSYDLRLINKKDYDLEIEKEKLKVINLSQKLLSYDIKKGIVESITKDETKELCDLIKNNEDYFKHFILILNEFSQSKLEMPIKVFEVINNIIQNYLDEISNKNIIKNNIKTILSIVMISFIFFINKNNQKYYLKEELKNNKVFKSIDFWKSCTISEIDEDLKKIKGKKKDGEKEELKRIKKINDIFLSKMLSSVDFMLKYEIDKDNIIKAIEPLMDKYKMDEKSKEFLSSYINKLI